MALSTAAWGTIVMALVTASFPFYLYGAKIIIDAEVVTWAVLIHHLKYISVGLLLTTVPVVGWMLPRLLVEITGIRMLHAILGIHAYALLAFALTGIVRIFQVKRERSLYDEPDPEIDIDELHPNMGAWRMRLRVGVAGYVLLWLLAYLTGLVLYVQRYVLI